jgi:hypothetical protein
LRDASITDVGSFARRTGDRRSRLRGTVLTVTPVAASALIVSLCPARLADHVKTLRER